MKRKICRAALVALSMTAVGSAYATKTIENDALAVEVAKIGLAQAVTSAEQHVGGKASRAEFEKYKGQWVFDVEVVSGKKVMEVKVDPTAGKVLAVTEDKNDHNDNHDPAD